MIQFKCFMQFVRQKKSIVNPIIKIKKRHNAL